MNKELKLVLDGTLFAECELHGANRDGMMRLTEDITDRLIHDTSLDISFAGTLYIEKYDRALKKFVQDTYPDHIDKIFSNKPLYISNLLKWKGLFRKKLAGLPLYPYYKKINQADLFHSFYYPFTSGVLKNKIKRSITYLDIIPLRREGYPADLVNRTKDIVNCIASNYAISISEYSKQDLLDYDKRIKEEQVFVVPLAASPTLFYKNTNEAEWQRVKQKYDLPENFFLCVSGNDTRKNIHHIIASFNEFMMQEKPDDIFLVLTGNSPYSRAMMEEMNMSDEVKAKIFIPQKFIDSEDLAAIYSKSVSFFFMSLYEGFGLPALEAMQCGVPVVTSNTTSLPEVVGNAGITLDPLDVPSLADTMRKLYNDSSLRLHYVNESIKRAATFSWQRCADEYSAIFKKIVSQ